MEFHDVESEWHMPLAAAESRDHLYPGGKSNRVESVEFC